MNIILHAKDISKSYKDGEGFLEVIKNINFKLKKSEIIIIKGPSGSGKTTFLNILNTIDFPDTGRVVIDGKNVVKNNNIQIEEIRSRSIGILFQDSNLIEELNILENLKIAYSFDKHVNHHDPITLLKQFHLESKINHHPNELSGGERQRVALLRAIINKPKIVFADEPTGNLDDDNIKIMIELISSLRINYNTSFIITTHDERLCDIADKIYYIKDCKLWKRNEDK